MSILYYYATIYNSLVIGTGNKTELQVGYFTKHGDGGVDLLPIGDLYKMDVKKVAQELGVPSLIIKKPPEELGMTYNILDKLLYLYLEEEYSMPDIAKELEIPESEVERIINMVNNASHKRNKIPILSKN